MKMNYHQAHVIIAKGIKKKLDRIITEIMVETSENDKLSLEDRLTLIDAIPLECERLISTLDASIDYNTTQMEKED